MKKKIAIIGGDDRTIKLIEYLTSDQIYCYVYGIKAIEFIDNNHLIKICNNMDNAIKNADYVLASVPLSQDDKTVFAPLFDEKIYIDQLAESLLKNNSILIAGAIKENILEKLTQKGIKVFDLYKREELSILNAIPTVEGCIMLAIQNTPWALHSRKILVLGFGRIGKLLSKTLKAFECKIFVAARKSEDITWIRAFGYNAVEIKRLRDCINEMDLIVNTIPFLILDGTVLEHIRKETLIIDLASKPGGVDFEYAKKKGITTIHALSLPGKVAPSTAAEYIKEAFYNLLNELEGLN